MSYTLYQKHTSYNFRAAKNRSICWIVLHYTGNKTDTAKGNAGYFAAGYRGASAHYFVDDAAVYEVVTPKNIAFAVGVNYGTNNLFGTCTNANSISIEMCSTGGKITDATMQNATELTRRLMAEYSISADHVVRHYGVYSKQCPGWVGWGTSSGDSGKLWKEFKNMLNPTVKKAAYDKPEQRVSFLKGGVALQAPQTCWLRPSATRNSDRIQHITKGEKLRWYGGYTVNQKEIAWLLVTCENGQKGYVTLPDKP